MKISVFSTVSKFIFVMVIVLVGQGLVAKDLTLQAGLAYYPDPGLDTVVLLDFPFTLNSSDFEYFLPDSSDGIYYARIYAEVKLIGDDGLAIDSAKTYFSTQAATLEDTRRSGLKLFDKLSLIVKPGIYSARLTVIDVVSKDEGVAFYDRIEAKLPVVDYLTLSSLSMAYNIVRAGNQERLNAKLTRNGFTIYANPLGVFSTSDTLAYLYAELYNIAGVGELETALQVSYRLEDELGRTQRDFGTVLQKRLGRSVVLSESLDLLGVPAGVYNLRLSVTDSVIGQTVVQRTPLMILPPATFTAEAVEKRYADDPYDTLAAQTKVNLVNYLLNPDQKKVLGSLSEEGKLNYLDQFWQEQDEFPGTKEIENRLELIERYTHANRSYSGDLIDSEGWATDRGRIYMLHGEPDRKSFQLMPNLDSPNESFFHVSDPYEVWYYYSIEEGKEVVFVDVTGLENYELVHSTFDGDIYSSYWYSILKGPEVEIDH